MLPCEFYYNSHEGTIWLRKVTKKPELEEPGVLKVTGITYGRDFSFKNFQGVTEVRLEVNGCVLYKESVHELSEYILPFFRGKSFVIPPGTAFAIIQIILKGTFPPFPELEYTQVLAGCSRRYLDSLSYFEKIPGDEYIILGGGSIYPGKPQPRSRLINALKCGETVKEVDPNYMKVYFRLPELEIPPFCVNQPHMFAFELTGSVEIVFEVRFRHLLEEYIRENKIQDAYYSEYRTVNTVATVLVRKTEIQKQIEYIDSVSSGEKIPCEVYLQ